MKFIFFSIATILFFGCKALILFNKPVQQGILKKAEGCALDSRSNCLLYLKDITNFDWDRLYIFSEYANCEGISKIIGFTYHNNVGFVPDEAT